MVGLDEAGRGPLAGPVIAAAVRVNVKCKMQNAKLKFKVQNFKELKTVKDSKQLSPKKREELYKILINHRNIEWGIGRVSEKTIDRINILEATKLAMERAVNNLNYKLQNTNYKQIVKRKSQNAKIDYLILDGNFKLNLSISQKSIVKADQKVFSCAAASILAKVTRDRIMLKYHKKYPQYGFAQHKGYPTKLHQAILKKYGLCKIHRKSFGPVKRLLTKEI